MLSEGSRITEINIQLENDSKDLNDNIRKRRTKIEAEASRKRKSIVIVNKKESIDRGPDHTKDKNKDKDAIDKNKNIVTKEIREAQVSKKINKNPKKLKNQRSDRKPRVIEANLVTSSHLATQMATD